MAIQFVGRAIHVGTVGSGSTSLTSLTGGIGTEPGPDDVSVAQVAYASNADRAPAAAGYTQVAQQRLNDTIDAGHYVGWKVMGATPDTSFAWTVPTGSSSSGMHVLVEVWRGVDTTTVEDVAAVLAGGLNTAIPTLQGITPVTSGARILSYAASAHDQGAGQTLTSSGFDSEFTATRDQASFDVTVLRGEKDWSSGAFSPGAATFSGTDSNTFSWCTVTMVLRPASGSGITGAGAGTMPLGGAGAGTVDVAGAGAGTMPMGGVGTGTVDVAGAGAGTMPLGGAGDGTVAVTGAGAGTMPLGGAGAGVVGSAPVTGAGAGTMPMGGSGAGDVDVSGVGAGAMPMGGGGTAAAAVAGSGAGVMPVVGGGAGSVGSAPATGTGAGTMPISGAGTATVAVTGTGAGAMPMAGTGAGVQGVIAPLAAFPAAGPMRGIVGGQFVGANAQLGVVSGRFVAANSARGVSLRFIGGLR